jgi:hypothetical protein
LWLSLVVGLTFIVVEHIGLHPPPSSPLSLDSCSSDLGPLRVRWLFRRFSASPSNLLSSCLHLILHLHHPPEPTYSYLVDPPCLCSCSSSVVPTSSLSPGSGLVAHLLPPTMAIHPSFGRPEWISAAPLLQLQPMQCTVLHRGASFFEAFVPPPANSSLLNASVIMYSCGSSDLRTLVISFYFEGLLLM